MSYTANDIYERITGDEELVHFIPLIDDIAILEYDGKDISGSMAVAKYLKELDFVTNKVKRIVLFGKANEAVKSNVAKLTDLFPEAVVSVSNKPWNKTDIKKLKVANVLVLHMARATGFRLKDFSTYNKLWEIVRETRSAYYACFINKAYTQNLFDNECFIIKKFSLSDLKFTTPTSLPERTSYCEDNEDYMRSCINNKVFFQCLEVVKQGCEDCNQSGNYGKRHLCPIAQRYIARFYREGIFVPKDEKIAHQWELMAAHQGYQPATVQVADDLKDGAGCEKDVEKAVEIYSRYASQNGNESLAEKIITLADSELIPYPVAIPYIAMLANSGNEDMVIRLSDSFRNGSYGLPKDTEQQKEWIEQGAENGNPRFVQALAKLYEENKDWENAYQWYKRLAEVAPDLVKAEKLEEIELRMLTNGNTNKDVAVSGRNYLYGWFGKERDTNLAYRCIKYASDKGESMAIGLLGRMYYKGIEVEKDEDKGLELLKKAALAGDLMSIGELTDIGVQKSPTGGEWSQFIPKKIREGINKNDPAAFYLKGYYYSIGFCYDKNEHLAYNNMYKAADMGLPIAQYKLALMYEKMEQTEENKSQFMKWLKAAAANGYYEAEGRLGMMWFNDYPYNEAEITFKYLNDAWQQGFDDVYWEYAQCKMNGYGTVVDRAEAFPLYIRAAENGIAEAQEELCKEYFKGNEVFSKDYNTCAKWGEKAIANGRRNVRFETAYASSSIGNHERAKELYLELANEGDEGAMNNYACELPDPKEKALWFRRAADHGGSYGYWNLAKLYLSGYGVIQDYKKAFELMEKAASMGHKYAMEDLGDMYIKGKGTEVDGKKAIEWFRKSAEKGNLSAMVRLGNMYENGTGIERNIETAKAWYRRAATKGNHEAQECLRRLHSYWFDELGNIKY